MLQWRIFNIHITFQKGVFYSDATEEPFLVPKEPFSEKLL